MTDRRALAFLAAIAFAVALGAWLRLHGLGEQILLDDEWHALHKLMASGYGDIFRSFGEADHSIPLTLFYKALSETIGLDEIDLRLLQAACGIALIPLAARLARAMTGERVIAVLVAFLVAGAPFLVLYSRFARPYAITTLLTVCALALIWRWRAQRRARGAALACVAIGLSAWLHPVSALFPAVALAFVLAQDLASERSGRAARVRSTVGLGLGAALAIALPLAAPLAHDAGSLAVKAGGDHAGAYTVSRMLSLFMGGLPDPLTAVAVAIAAYGAWRFSRTQPALAAYLAVLALVPPLIVMLLGAKWTQQGHTFGRYLFPVQLIVLFWFALGWIGLVRALARRPRPALEFVAAGLAAVAYLAINPAIGQVRTLGPWYGHLNYHFDYVPMHSYTPALYAAYEPPAFYRRLGKLAPNAAPLIEAPFNFVAPASPIAYLAQFHRQPERMGMVHDLCRSGPRVGEVPKDRRFRFRNFVFLDDVEAVRASGARYIVLQLDQWLGGPYADAPRCLAALTRLYGEPVEVSSRIAVFDLAAGKRPRG